MKANITSYTAACLIFLLLLIASGSLSGVISEAVYILAFVIPIAIGILSDKRRRAREAEDDREYPKDIDCFTLSREGLRLALPTVVPVIAAVFLLSSLTAYLIQLLTGVTDSVSLGDDLFLAIMRHAFLPALFEEMLFRYLPIKMLSRYSTRVTVVISSLYFALVHVSFFSIPYAFAAGLLLITVDLISGSIWPSVIIHFLNNALSVLWAFYYDSQSFALWTLASVAVLSLVSMAFIVSMKQKYAQRLKELKKINDSCGYMYEAVMLAVPALIIAVGEFVQ